MELRHRERPHIFPSQLTSIYGWIGYQQLSPTIQHINLIISSNIFQLWATRTRVWSYI
nr:MAG TPA: hypothetical protein [Caudoviricetes sp.]